jgi:hypothetical protein
MLGHASAAMTLDVYADLFDDDLTGVAERLDEIVGKKYGHWADERATLRARNHCLPAQMMMQSLNQRLWPS